LIHKNLFEGGVPGETYGEGVRRRVKSGSITFLIAAVVMGLTYGVYLLTDSIWATVVAAILCGLLSVKADLGVDPIKSGAPSRSDKTMWLILFIPAIVVLGISAVYAAFHAREVMDVMGVALIAYLFGCVLGFTASMIFGRLSRARA
jgi:hypothetical protein